MRVADWIISPSFSNLLYEIYVTVDNNQIGGILRLSCKITPNDVFGASSISGLCVESCARVCRSSQLSHTHISFQVMTYSGEPCHYLRREDRPCASKGWSGRW